MQTRGINWLEEGFEHYFQDLQTVSKEYVDRSLFRQHIREDEWLQLKELTKYYIPIGMVRSENRLNFETINYLCDFIKIANKKFHYVYMLFGHYELGYTD